MTPSLHHDRGTATSPVLLEARPNTVSVAGIADIRALAPGALRSAGAARLASWFVVHGALLTEEALTRRFIRALSRSAYALPIVIGVSQAEPAEAVPVVGTFESIIINILGDEEAGAPFFGRHGDIITGRFGYDTDAATDSLPDDPLRGVYTFADTAFLSITAPAGTLTTDITLSPIAIIVGIFTDNQTFQIRDGLVPQAEVPLATGDVALGLSFLNSSATAPFQSTDALPTSTIDLGIFQDTNIVVGGNDVLPFLYITSIRTLSIETVSVPEHAALGLLGCGALGIAGARRRKAQLRFPGRLSVT